MSTQSCVTCGPYINGDCCCWMDSIWDDETQEWEELERMGVVKDSVYGTDYDAIIQHYREVENSGPEIINYVPRMQLLR